MKNLNRLLNWLAPVLFVLFAASCDDGDPGMVAGENLIVMKAYYFGSNGGDDPLVVVTDTDGRILGAVKGSRWQDTPIRPSVFGFDGDLVNVYVVYASDSTYSINAFLNLKRGSEFDGPNYEFQSPQFKPLKVTLSNVESFNRLTLSGDYGGLTIENVSDTTGRLRLGYAENDRLFGQVVSGDEGRFGFADIDEQTGTATLNVTSLSETSLKAKIELDPFVRFSSFYLKGSFDTNARSWWAYDLYSTWGRSHLDIFYPSVTFNKYFSGLSYSTINRSYTEERVATTLDLTYKKFDFDAEVSSADPQQFKMTTSGDFDFYVAMYHSADWANHLIVYNSQKYGEFSIPDFSEISGLRKFPFSKLKIAEIELRDYLVLTEDEKHFKFFTSGKFDIPGSVRTVNFVERIN
jgi:hypothetical protein